MEQYWGNICNIAKRQREKGIKKYGQVLENNTVLSDIETVEYLQEELIDGLMYCEHLKVKLPSITPNEYQEKAMRTASGSTQEDLVLNGALGLSGESGEVADIIKKYKFQGHDLDTKKIIEELGDVCWYVAILAKGIGVDLEDIMTGNIRKLEKRYPDGFDVEKSINR